MIPKINDYSKWVYEEVSENSPFSTSNFHVVAMPWSDQDFQVALHTNLGSITVLERMTGFGWFDVETGFRDPKGKFWLASGMCDIREAGVKTIGEAVEWIKENSNTCRGGLMMTMKRLLNNLYLLISFIVVFFIGLVIDLLIIMRAISEGVLLLTVAVGLVFHLLWVHRGLL